jgi:ATP/maltotriose-dependent transcriptional regulator MalT/DNA-binding SARP family transcriptional activator
VVEWQAGERGDADGAGGVSSVQTPAAKLHVPETRPPLVRRARLEGMLDDAFGKRLTVVTAGAGFGKSTLLASWVADVEHAWYTLTEADRSLAVLAPGIASALRCALPDLADPLAGGSLVSRGGSPDRAAAEAFAALLAGSLHELLRHDVVLVLDDVHELDGAAAPIALVEGLCRQAPATLHLVLVSRSEAPFPIGRLRGRGEVLELTGPQLAFGVDELTELAASSSIAAELHAVTGGWPAAARLALDALGRRPAGGGDGRELALLHRPGAELYSYLAEEAFAGDPPELRELIRTAALFERTSVALCRELGVPDAEVGISDLVRRGLAAQSGDWMSLHALVSDFTRRAWPFDAEEAASLHRRAAAWLEAAGLPAEALRSLAEADEPEEYVRVLSSHGPALLNAGGADRVVAAAQLVPDSKRSPALELVLGEAHTALGDLDRALDCLRRAAGGEDAIPSSVGWRLAKAQLLQDDLEGVVRTRERTVVDPSRPDEEALLCAWTASAYYRRGDADAARALSDRALRAADRSGDPQAKAAAHAAVAMAMEAVGDFAGADLHQRRALDAAERAHDVLQLCRVRNNRGSLLLDQGLYADAIDELATAIELAELGGFPQLLGLALMNRGLCRWCLGRLDEANADYEAAVGVYRQSGTSEISYALIGRGDVHRERGELALARRFYEEGLAMAERSGDRQGLVPGLYQLAKVIVDDEPDRADELVDRAVSYGWPDRAWALNAAGWIALAHGDADRAGSVALEAEDWARGHSDRFGLAEALELRAFTVVEPARRRDVLGEALSLWQELGNEAHEAAVELALARLSSGVAAQAAAHRAGRRLRRLGIRVSPSGPAGLLRTVALETDAPLTIETLGAFRIHRAGETVPRSGWRSKKARDLLKLLIAHGGRPVPRELLMEQLWPGQSPERLSNRLSVAISTVRSTLDPEKRDPPDHFVSAGEGAVAVRLDSATVDVQLFLHDAAAGLALRTAGRADEAADRLEAAEAAYAGDFLEEDLYEDWAVPLREEARAAYFAVLRALAEDALAAGNPEATIRYDLRLLERDRFDEGAHLALVGALSAAGRHGEALRRYRVYCACMAEIGIEAAPFAGAARV